MHRKVRHSKITRHLLNKGKAKNSEHHNPHKSKTVIKGTRPFVVDHTGLATTDGPNGRKWHTATQVGNKIIMLGGEAVTKQFRNDIHILNLDTMTWTKSDVTLPEPVAGHCCVVMNNALYYYGGISRQGVYYGSVYRVNLDDCNMPASVEDMNARYVNAGQANWPARPFSREGQSWTVLDDHRILMFGGFGLRNGIRDFFNDVHILDIQTMLWTKIDTTGIGPSPRFYHSATLIGRKLWVHGGWTGYSRENDVYVLDIDKWKWKRVIPINEQKRQELDDKDEWQEQDWENENGELAPRSEHATIVMGKKLIIIAGMGSHFVRGDIVIIDTETLTWSEVKSDCCKDMMVRSGLTATLVGTSIYIVGGHHDLNVTNNIFVLKTERPIERREVFPQASLLSDMSSLWENREFCDLVLIIEGQEVPVHKSILWIRCPYFRSMFSCGMTETKKSCIKLADDVVKLHAFYPVLEFIYTSQCQAIHDDIEACKEVLILANALMMEDLVALCENRLIETLDKRNVLDLLELATSYFAAHLRRACVNFISNHFDSLADSLDFDSLPMELKEEIMRLKSF